MIILLNMQKQQSLANLIEVFDATVSKIKILSHV